MNGWLRSPVALALVALNCGISVLDAQRLKVLEARTQSQSVSATNLPGVGWTLSQVLRRALTRHPLVEAASGRVAAAVGNRAGAGAFANPLLTYQVENGSFFGSTRPPGVSTETSFFATLPIEDLYQRWPRMRRADQETVAARSDLVAARRQVVLDATRAFYRVALAQASVEAASEIQRGLESLAAYNQSRVSEGIGAEGDLIRVQVEVERAATSTILEEVELARARASLLPFIAHHTDPAPPLDSVEVTLDDPPLVADSLPPLGHFVSLALQGRPDLRAARARAAAAKAEVSFQRSLLFRQVGLVFGTKRVSGANTLIAGLTLPLPLFEQNRGGREAALGERTAAEAELAWSERLARADVEAAYRAAELLTRQVKRLQGTFMARADESRRITLAAYEEGAATLLQVLDVSRAWADAQVVYYQTLFAQRQNVLELNVAAGLEPEVAATAPSPRSSVPAASRPGDSQ
ncbi:MAG: TolC family protein [Gemmatimonadales bacterium]